MADPSQPAPASRAARDLGRAAGGALLFALPMLMTMELWWLGIYLDRARLLVLIASALPLLVVLSHHIGFESTHRLRSDLIDSLIALGVAAATCTLLLLLFGALTMDDSAEEWIGKIAIQMVPASIGALLAKSQFGKKSEDEMNGEENYGSELFLMGVGALFLAFNVAPTEEMMLISFRMTQWHAIALVLLALVVMHGFVFAVGFAGGSEVSPEDPWWSAFVRLTLPGYAIASMISLYLLWIFARTDGMDAGSILMAVVVLSFPAAIGAAAARLIL